MSSPNTRLMTEEEELMYDAGQMDGRDKERERIITLLRNNFAETNLQKEIIKLIKGDAK
jgi:hypothetical protein